MKSMPNNDQFIGLLSKCQPEMDLAFSKRISDTLHCLSDEDCTAKYHIPAFARKKPLAFAGILLLALLLISCTAYAIGLLYHAVFISTADAVVEQPIVLEERRQYWDQRYDLGQMEEYEIRGPQEADQEDKSTTIDAITDFEANLEGSTIGLLEELKQNLGVVGIEDQGIILSEIALLESRPRQFFIGAVLDSLVEFYAITPFVRIDGYDQNLGSYYDYTQDGILGETSKQYAIFQVPLIRAKEYLKKESLIEIKILNASYAFYYAWDSHKVTTPANAREKAEWLQESAALHNAIDHTIHTVLLPNEMEGVSFEIVPQKFYMQEFDIIFEADLYIKDAMENIDPRALLSVNGIPYRTGEENVQTYWLHDRSQSFRKGCYQIGWRWQIPIHYDEQPNQFIVGVSIDLNKEEPAVHTTVDYRK